AWLFAHFRGVEDYSNEGLLYELFDFFKDVAWTTPAIGVATFLACAAGPRRHLSSLRAISQQASQIVPQEKHASLPVHHALTHGSAASAGGTARSAPGGRGAAGAAAATGLSQRGVGRFGGSRESARPAYRQCSTRA